jgi:hypothetical protein
VAAVRSAGRNVVRKSLLRADQKLMLLLGGVFGGVIGLLK